MANGMPHLHVSAMDALVVGAYVVIFAAFWHTISVRYADRPVGQAMAFIL